MIKKSSNEKKNLNELRYSFKRKKIVQMKNKQTKISNKIVKKHIYSLNQM